MERFKTFLNEAATDIRAINRSDQLKLGKAIVLPYTVGKSTKSTTTIIIRGPKDDRGQLKKDVEARLKKANIKHSAIRGGGSTGQTEVPFKTHKIRITYKPLSGGMSETTLNSTITELAPAIAFMSGQTLPIWDFEDVGDNWTKANSEKIAPIIAVPTTAGTGSETGRASVILNEETGVKNIIFHPKFLPSIVILDPVLTVGLPSKITAATGMDALAHNLEAYCAPGYHPMADGIALEGMRIINDWLLEAVNNGSNIEARQNMLTAASMGSTAFQKGLGAIHSLSHPVNALNNIHHGLSNAIFMPYVLTFNKDVIEKK